MTEVVAVHTPENAALDVVFIHGLDGDARNSWRRKDPSSFWPLWLAEDVPGVAVWSVGYDGWSSNWRGRAMPMQDRAINLLAQLQNYGIGERPFCFVTHSMGGLLVKEMLLHAAEGHTDFASFATAAKQYSRGFAVRVRRVAYCDLTGFWFAVTFCHLLPVVLGQVLAAVRRVA